MAIQASKPFTFYQTLIVALARSIPAGTRGKHRLIRKLLPLSAGSQTIVLADGTSLLVPDLHEPVAFCSLIDGQYEPETLSILQLWLKEGGHFIDVGANVGAIALPVAKYLGSKGKVLAIEGSPHIAEHLQASLQLNALDNLLVENVLCGEASGEADFYQAPDSHFGMGSRGAQFDQAPTRLQMRRLDDIAASFRPVRAMKVDVEGFEYQVFVGATHILREDKPDIIFEFCDWADGRNTDVAIGDAQQLLMDMGYNLWTLDAYRKNAKALLHPINKGSEMLIAKHPQSL
jgi:FkbM family methyltransferase